MVAGTQEGVNRQNVRHVIFKPVGQASTYAIISLESNSAS